MRSLISLTIANVRSFVRDRAALFWTIVFPVIFIVLFGSIFSGGGSRLQPRHRRPGRHADLAGARGRLHRRRTAQADPGHRGRPAGIDEAGQGRCGPRHPEGLRGGLRRRRPARRPRRCSCPCTWIRPTPPARPAISQVTSAIEAGFEQRLDHVRARGGHPDDRRAGRPAVGLGLLRAQHPGHGPHAAGHLQRHPAGRAAREADPQAAERRRRCRAGRWSAATSSCA